MIPPEWIPGLYTDTSNARPFLQHSVPLNVFDAGVQGHDNYLHSSEDRFSGTTMTWCKVMQRSLCPTNFPQPWSATKIQLRYCLACVLPSPAEGVGTTAIKHYSNAPS